MDATHICRKVGQNMLVVNSTKQFSSLGVAGIIQGMANAYGAAKTREANDLKINARLGPGNYGRGHFIAASRHVNHMSAFARKAGGVTGVVLTEAKRSEAKYIADELPTPVSKLAILLSADGISSGQDWLVHGMEYYAEAEAIYNDLVTGQA